MDYVTPMMRSFSKEFYGNDAAFGKNVRVDRTTGFRGERESDSESPSEEGGDLYRKQLSRGDHA